MNVGRTGVNEHGEGVVAHAGVRVDHHLALHVHPTDSTAFGHVARREHDLGCIKGIGHAVVGEFHLG